MFHNQKRLKLMMISCILVTLMFESGVYSKEKLDASLS